ncbi:MAG: hypothetical protein HXY40_14775 [Chloroflexi bacterium]|nr:hypothetical protein [Chloroflexota bacterium]
MDQTWLPYALTATVLCCIVPLIIAGIMVFFAVQRGSEIVGKLVTPDPVAMQKQYDTLQKRKPDLSRDKLIEDFIHGQALKCGAIGALTSFTGFITLPITLPLDVLASLRIQATMVQFIASAYGHNQPGELEKQVQSYLIMSGGMQVTEKTGGLVMKLIVRLLGQTFAKFVPFLGALVGFGVNYFFTQAAGRLAAKWYASQKPKTG